VKTNALAFRSHLTFLFTQPSMAAALPFQHTDRSVLPGPREPAADICNGKWLLFRNPRSIL